MPSVEELVAVKQQVEQRFLSQPGVTGIDVGYKVVGGEHTEEIAVRVHVARKSDDIPDDQRVPEAISGFVTDVVERVYVLHVASQPLAAVLEADTRHVSPLTGGVSMGPSRAIDGSIFAGTLGAIVIDNTTGARVGLTNFHVACVDQSFRTGDRMVQPSRIDTGVVPLDEFGALLRATLSGAVDGALISIDPGKQSLFEVSEIGSVRGTKKAALGMTVRKRGRTTGLTHGKVDGVSGSIVVDYGDGIGSRTLTNQVSIAANKQRNAVFSDHGDSGSVIVDDSGFVVALLFAGSDSNTVGNQIADVLSELNISMGVAQPQEAVKDVTAHMGIASDRRTFATDRDVVGEAIAELRAKVLKDMHDHIKVRELYPYVPPNPIRGQNGLESRLRAVEVQLAGLSSFIGADQRPDLLGSAFPDGPKLTQEQADQLRAELERQVAESVGAKTEFDTPMA